MLFEKVSALCKERGISIAKLEKETNLGNATIRGWKNSSPRVSSLKKVADFFGCAVDDLLKEEKE